MPKTTSLPVTQSFAFGSAQFTNSDSAATTKTVLTAGANDTIVKGLQAMSSETATARVIDILVNDGSADRWIGAVNVPLNSGFSGIVAAVDLLASILMPGLPIDASGKKCLPLKAGHVLKVRNQTQVASGKEVNVIAFAEDF